MKLLPKPFYILSVILCLNMDAMALPVLHSANRYGPVTERTYVHTDRDIYIAGETLFFKIYVVDNTTLQPTGKSKLVYISLRNEYNRIIMNTRAYLNRGIAFGSIYLPDTLSTGYYQLQSFTNCMRNGPESSYFSSELFIANQFDKQLVNLSKSSNLSGTQDTLHMSDESTQRNNLIRVNTDKSRYENREKITLSISVDGAEDPKTISNVSVSVYEQPPAELPNYTIAQYFKRSEKNISNETNSWLPAFLTEFQGQIIQGKVIESQNGNSIAGATVFLSAVDTVANLKYTKTDTNGMFRFLLEPYYDKKDLNFKVSPRKDKVSCKIIFDDKFSFKTDFIPEYFRDTTSLLNYIYASQTITKIHKSYHPRMLDTDTMAVKNQVYQRPYDQEVYEKATWRIRPAEYVFLPDFLEITRELVPPMTIRKKGGRYECFFLDTTRHENMEGTPAIFLDGILADDINEVVNLNSDQITRIDCLNNQRIVGDFEFDGIVAVFTKKKESDHLPMYNNFRIAIGQSLNSSTLYNPDYTRKKESHLPDYRQLLYWNPDVELKGASEKKCEFFASDQSGRYIINVEGVTSDGRIIHKRTFIDINSSEK